MVVGWTAFPGPVCSRLSGSCRALPPPGLERPWQSIINELATLRNGIVTANIKQKLSHCWCISATIMRNYQTALCTSTAELGRACAELSLICHALSLFRAFHHHSGPRVISRQPADRARCRISSGCMHLAQLQVTDLVQADCRGPTCKQEAWRDPSGCGAPQTE